MDKRRLGKTNLNISAVGFGGIPIQKLDKESAIELIKCAVENGINFMDSARGYAQSEKLLGYGIKETGRDKWIIATKSPVRSYDEMKKDIETSLENFGVEYIDLYQLHNVKTQDAYDKVMSDDGALRALKEAKQAGKIKYIGITSHSLEMLEAAVETGEFETIQFPYNPVERQAEELFKRAKDLDIGVIVMKPVAGGAITNVEYSLRFILENKNVTVVIPGMNEVKHIEDNAAVASPIRALTEEERVVIETESKGLGTEFCRRCGYCGPCTVGIDIPTQFVLEGYLTRYGLPDWAKMRYEGQQIKADACIECGACEPKCPYDLPIIKMLKRVKNNFEK